VQTDQNKAALRSLFELKDAASSPSVDLYFGPSPPAGQEGRWIKTTPGKGWFAYLRIYGPEQAAFDRSWKPGDFQEIESIGRAAVVGGAPRPVATFSSGSRAGMGSKRPARLLYPR
jgi:hypothetical protein